MLDNYIKVNLPKIDCRNIYFLNDNNIFNVNEIVKAPTYMQNNFRLFLRLTYVNQSGVRTQTKKVFKFGKHITFIQALKEVSSYREQLLNKLQNDEHKEIKIKIPTLQLAWEDFMVAKKNKISDETHFSYDKFVRKWILSKPTLAKMPITNINVKHLQSIVNEILDLGKSPRTAKSVKDTRRPIFKQYMQDGTITVNPAEIIQLPKFNNEVDVELSHEKTKELYDALFNYPIEPFRSIFVWLSHGRRLNEVLSLEWADINIENQTYNIRFENNKVRKPMTYKLSDELLKTLNNLGVKKSGYIFHAVNDESQKMSNHTLRNHWKKVLKQVDVKLRIHDLRHIIGGTLVSNGKTLEHVASVLGHTSIAVTKRYSKVRQEVAAESLDDFFSRVRG